MNKKESGKEKVQGKVEIINIEQPETDLINKIMKTKR
jgi:hypothetical protein